MYNIFVGDKRQDKAKMILWASFALSIDADIFAKKVKEENPAWFVYIGCDIRAAEIAFRSMKTGGLDRLAHTR